MADEAVTLKPEDQKALDEHKRQIQFAISTVKGQIKELKTQQREATKLIETPGCDKVLNLRDMIVSCSRQIDVYLDRLLTLQAMLTPQIKMEPAKAIKAKRQSFQPGAQLLPQPSVFTPSSQASIS